MSREPKEFDFERLVDPRCFQPLPDTPVPKQFELSADKSKEYDLSTLIDKKFYLQAARKAQEELVSISDKKDYEKIFHLWYVRLSSLLLARFHAIAREESRVLGDLGTDTFRTKDGICIVPWKLRVVVVPLQSRGNNQIGISRYYMLAREAIVEAGRETAGVIDRDEWKKRVHTLGLHVAAMLVGMKDYLTAIDHLQTMHSTLEDLKTEEKEFSNLISSVIALCYLQMGDTLSARQWFSISAATATEKTSLYSAICSLADADWADSAKLLLDENSKAEKPSEEVLNNLAVAKLHEGDLSTALIHLESLVKQGSINHIVLFNLFTLYDLQKVSSERQKSEIFDVIKESGVESLGSYEFLNA